MENKLIKTLSLCMTCLTVILLLNVVSQRNIVKKTIPIQVNMIMSTNVEDPPWI